MSEPFTMPQFEEQKDAPFRLLRDEAEPLEARITEVKRLLDGAGEETDQGPFSVLFRIPGEPLAQKIYELENEALGQLALFLVPIQPDGEATIYEAVFA